MMAKAKIFKHHYNSLQCHMILQKLFWYADTALKKLSLYVRESEVAKSFKVVSVSEKNAHCFFLCVCVCVCVLILLTELSHEMW